jgi:thioredoxin-related protein
VRAFRFALRVATIAVVVFACACAKQDLAPKFDPARDAAGDVANAVALAKAQGKRVIVDVGGEWCSWCHILDGFIASNDDVKSLVDSRYVWVKVNYSKENRNEVFLSRWPQVAGYPHLFVLDEDGKLLHSQDTGELEAGNSYDKARMVAFFQQWAGNGTPHARAGNERG